MKNYIVPILCMFTVCLFTGCSEDIATINIYQEDAVLDSQEEINEFGTRGYQIILGDLQINGNDITTLEPLRGLIQVAGNLNIVNNPQLTNLNGLEHLRRVRKSFMINHNQTLNTLEHLTTLEQVDESFTIQSNKALTNLNGLSNLQTISNKLLLDANALIDVSALYNLRELGELHIREEPLDNLYGLYGLRSLRDLRLEGIVNLTDMSDLSLLQQVDDEIYLGYNRSLQLLDFKSLTVVGRLFVERCGITNLSGLQPLQLIDGIILIQNPHLKNLNGIDNLEEFGALIASDNLLLNDYCALQPKATESSLYQYDVRGNKYNPSRMAFLEGECSE